MKKSSWRLTLPETALPSAVVTFTLDGPGEAGQAAAKQARREGYERYAAQPKEADAFGAGVEISQDNGSTVTY